MRVVRSRLFPLSNIKCIEPSPSWFSIRSGLEVGDMRGGLVSVGGGRSLGQLIERVPHPDSGTSRLSNAILKRLN